MSDFVINMFSLNIYVIEKFCACAKVSLLNDHERQQIIIKLLTKLNEAEEIIKTVKEWQTLKN